MNKLIFQILNDLKSDIIMLEGWLGLRNMFVFVFFNYLKNCCFNRRKVENKMHIPIVDGQHMGP